MKTRVAFLVNLGTFVGWFFLVPLVIWFNVPIYDAITQTNVPIQTYAQTSTDAATTIAFDKTVKTIAIGSIIGGECSVWLKCIRHLSTSLAILVKR